MSEIKREIPAIFKAFQVFPHENEVNDEKIPKNLEEVKNISYILLTDLHPIIFIKHSCIIIFFINVQAMWFLILKLKKKKIITTLNISYFIFDLNPIHSIFIFIICPYF